MRAWAVGLALLAAACQQGNGLGGPDLTPPPDLAPAADLTPAPDLLPPPNCGQIVACALECGAQGLSCLLGCGQNASPQAIAEAGALVACAAQNCLAADGGAGTLQIFQCLTQKCPTQLAGCEGLGL